MSSEIHVRGNNNHVAGRDVIVMTGGGSGGGGDGGITREQLLNRRAQLVEQFYANKRGCWFNNYFLWSIASLAITVVYLTQFGFGGITGELLAAWALGGIALPNWLLGSLRQRLGAENIALASQVRVIDEKLITMP